MSLRWEQVIIHAADPVSLGQWWAEALEWVVVNDDRNEFEIQRTPGELPGIMFEPVSGAKQAKNRLHLDFRPDEDQATHVQRLIELGARPIDIGQGDVSWVVLADPEGNEFCILAPEQ